MRKLLLSVAVLAIGSFYSCAQYCSPVYNTGCVFGDEINNFSTTGGLSNITNNGSGCSGGNYMYYTGAGYELSVIMGTSFDFSIQSGSYYQGFKIWIDYNHDNDFLDAGEEVWNSGSAATTPFSGTVNTPTTAMPGVTRMRVRSNYASLPTGPCSSQTYGEVEDYNITLVLPAANDAGIASIESPTVPTCSLGAGNLIVELANGGNDTLTACNINYVINGGATTTYAWTGTVAPFSTLSGVNIGSATFANGDDFTVWTDSPNGVADSLPSNDSVAITLQNGLSGTYIIDPSGAGDYLTFNDAVNDINAFGLCDDVTFKAVDGIYNEQITVNEVLNANDTNTVTFESYSGNAAACIVRYTGTSATDNRVVNIDGGDYYTFRNMTFFNPGYSYGRVIEIGNGAHKNRFEGNVIAGDSVITTSSTNRALVYSPSNSLDSMNVFEGNHFYYGSYAFYYYGVNAGSLEYGTKILNNHFHNNYYRSISFNYQRDVEIAGNTFQAGTAYPGAFYNVFLSYNNGETLIHDNHFTGNKAGYGLYLSQCDGGYTKRGRIYNNFIHVGDTVSTNSSYGIYLYGSDYQIISNNSINIESNANYTRGVYVSGSGNIIVRNNAIKNTSSGYGIYHDAGIVACDYNSVYVPNGVLFYQSGDINNLATWQANTGFGMHSYTLDPMFVSTDDLHTCASHLDGAAMVDTFVVYDIDGNMRDMNASDIGADEFLSGANIAFEEDTIWKCAADMVTLGGWQPATEATYQWSTLESTPTINVLTQGAYFVNISSACGNASPSVYVANYPDAVADFTLSSSFMTLIATNNSTGTINDYLWDFGDGTTSTDVEPVHVYADTGYYNVTLTVTGPCRTDTYTATMYSNTVGLDEVAIDRALNVYPNPNSGEFTIHLTLDQAADVKAQLMDLQGKSIWASTMGAINGTHTEKVDVSTNAPGVYVLRISVDGESAVRKIIIE